MSDASIPPTTPTAYDEVYTALRPLLFYVIADDFGEGKDAMQGLGLLRAEVDTPRASKYYDG